MWKNVTEKSPRYCTSCRLCCLFLCFLILLLGVAVLVVFLLFKQPQVEYVGIVPGSVESSVDNMQLNATSKLRFRVQNPNPIGLTFTKIEGTGRIPDSETTVAFGELENVSIPKQATTDILFPLTVSYNPTNDKNFAIAKYLIAHCTNGNQMIVNYTVRFYIVPLSTFGIVPTSERSSGVPCPDISKIATSELPGLAVPRGIEGVAGDFLASLPSTLAKWQAAA